MVRKPFLIFITVILVLVAGSLAFIQSGAFARILKGFVARTLPSDLGIEGDFSDLSVKIFPPGVSIRNPKIELKENNVADLLAGSSIDASELHLIFQPVQMLSGTIRVNEIRVITGKLHLILDEKAKPRSKAKSKSLRPEFSWDELFQIRAEAISASDTDVRVEWKGSDASLQFHAKDARIAQWSGGGGLGYEVQADVRAIEATPPKSMPALELFQRLGKVDQFEANVRVNAAGMQIHAAKVVGSGVDLQASGSIKGDVVSSKNLAMDLNLLASGAVEDMVRVLALKKTDALAKAEGKLSFKGLFRGNPADFMSTARLEGAANLEKAKFGPWSADSAKVEGAWVASPKGGEISLSKAVIESREVARSAPSQPGWGGRVEIGPAKISLESTASVQIPLKLHRAHLHWLAVSAVDNIFGLSFRLSGDVGVNLTLKPTWSIAAKLEGLKALEFQLDNQQLGKTKILSRVLAVPEVRLDGGVFVDASGLKPQGLTIAMAKSKFAVSGRLDFRNGYDLLAQGPVYLEDVGLIAESPIGGSGQLTTRIHGPLSSVQVDFETELSNAHYLGLQFGDLKGTISWDDSPSHLIFKDVQARKRRSAYSVDGLIDLSERASIDLKASIPQADIQDFMQIFGVLTKDLWWFPTTLSGPTSGTVSVSGGLELKKMTIATRMSGNSWEFHGERFKQVSLVGGYDKGRYFVSELKTSKRGGQISARVSYDGGIDWEMNTSDLQLNDFDLFAKLDVPIRGKVAIQSNGSGAEGEIKSNTNITISDTTVRGNGLPGSQLSIKTSGGVAKVSGSAVGGQGLFDVSYDFNSKNPSSLSIALRKLDFSPMLLLLNPKATQDRSLMGSITGSLNLNFNSGEIEKATGSAELSDYRLARTGASFSLTRPVMFAINNGSFDMRELSLKGEEGAATISLTSRKSELDGQVQGDVDLAILEFLTPAVPRARGTATIDVAIGGMLKAPTFFGRASLQGGSVQLAALESPFENLSGKIQIKQNVATIQGFEAELAGGRVLGEGKVEIFADRYPQINIKGRINGSKIKIYPFQYAKIRGGLKIHGDQLPYLMEGSIQVESAMSREKMLTGRQADSLRAVKYTPPPKSRSEGDYPLFKLNIDAIADEGVFIQNDLFDAELKGKVTVVNTVDAPRLLGSAEVIRGRMLFKEHSFQIQSATVNFDSPTVLNPAFNLISSTEINSVKVQLFASGRPDKWKVDLASNPVMPEAEILSLLAIGLTSAETRRIRADDRAVYERGEAASLLLHSLDFNREVQNKTGIQIQLDESVNTQAGNSVFRRPEEASATAAPKIVVKKRIGQKLDLSYGSTVGIGTNNQREVNAELHLTPGVSVLGVWDNFETFDTESRNRNSYGLDFKLQKRFK
jgi:hypothetical protein